MPYVPARWLIGVVQTCRNKSSRLTITAARLVFAMSLASSLFWQEE
jgi:hypothetical protein